MIYILIPYDTTLSIRVFRNFGLVEQVMRGGGGNWCIVFGYSIEMDECAPIWTWTIGKNGQISRERATQLPSESLLPLQ
jgi:hypothetical protein